MRREMPAKVWNSGSFLLARENDPGLAPKAGRRYALRHDPRTPSPFFSGDPRTRGRAIARGGTCRGARADAAQFEKIQSLIQPAVGEEKWEQIPWMASLWQARIKAAAAGKPILLWEMDGHPLGCV